jgi:hypothetical protein
MVGFDRLLNGALRLPPKRVFHLDLTPNPSVLMQLHGRETKAALHRSQAWERLAHAFVSRRKKRDKTEGSRNRR